MEWLAENWIFLVVAMAFVAMHVFGHGGHGGHRHSDEEERDAGKSSAQGTARRGHRH